MEKRGTPFGWQSWGVMSDKNSYDVDVAVSEYFKETLKPNGFCNSQGINVMSIDAWDGMNSEQRTRFSEVVKKNGQVPGSYVTPFCLWWNEDMLYRKICEGSQYTGYECVIKVNGKPAKLDGAYCLDPTHPGTKEFISREVQNKKKEGFEYLKVDFTSNGMVQADSYYNKDVTTAVEAYNEGFSHFISEVDKGEPMFIALSIAPIFPYQYGNSRRIACDTWGKIGQSEYSLNAVSGGWWTNEFYQYNDPDHLVMVGNDAEKETEGENRARITNGAVSGMVLVSDNYSLEDKSGRGDAKLSRERAQKILMNKDVNEMADFGRSARPVYGYREYNDKGDGAENCFVLDTEKYLYVSVVNYKDNQIAGKVALERLGLSPSSFSSVKELWSGADVKVGKDGLSYDVPGKDAKIYRFLKK
ncbi:alpha-galactosidase [Paraprevotella xylaniphila]|uniref:alpha-galactosidase n=1 Tax=Paraprevotella xylaniphila TaxID=454155 RepID=UPI0039F4B419